jgi:hypothetical protein
MKVKQPYRIQVKFRGNWKTGIIDYTKEEAELAKERMLSRGVQCRIVKMFE